MSRNLLDFQRVTSFMNDDDDDDNNNSNSNSNDNNSNNNIYASLKGNYKSILKKNYIDKYS